MKTHTTRWKNFAIQISKFDLLQASKNIGYLGEKGME